MVLNAGEHSDVINITMPQHTATENPAGRYHCKKVKSFHQNGLVSCVWPQAKNSGFPGFRQLKFQHRALAPQDSSFCGLGFPCPYRSFQTQGMQALIPSEPLLPENLFSV